MCVIQKVTIELTVNYIDNSKHNSFPVCCYMVIFVFAHMLILHYSFILQYECFYVELRALVNKLGKIIWCGLLKNDYTQYNNIYALHIYL